MNPGSPNHDHSLIDHHNWGNFHQVNYINNIITTHRFFLGGSPGLVVMGVDSCSKGQGFESCCQILDGHFFTLICSKNCIVCLKRPKTNPNRQL